LGPQIILNLWAHTLVNHLLNLLIIRRILTGKTWLSVRR